MALPRNLGFGGGSNAGFARRDERHRRAAQQRHARGARFPGAAARGFRDPDVFAVSCQIFFSDPAKLREETGLTQGWWEDGGLRVRHRIDDAVTDLFPCFYGGGGSCAFDREKFLELGGFDPLLAPFYLEDTDLGFMAWKRGWKVLYQPRSVVYHEHRGTIGKRFSEDQIQAVLKKNFLLFCWKNIHEWRKLAPHFAFAWAGALIGVLFGDAPGRPNLPALWRAFRQLPGAVRSRRRARALARISDTEAFRRPLGGYYRDRFASFEPGPGAAARAVRFALSDLPADARRRRLHVPDAARDGEAGGGARRGVARLAAPGKRQPGTARILRLGRVAGASQRQAARHGIAAAVCRARVRQFRSGVADSPPALSKAHRRAAARIHADGAISRRVPPHRDGALRARRLLSIDRARAWVIRLARWAR